LAFLASLNRYSPDGADPSRILAQSGSLGKLEPPSLPKDRPRVWCRLHLALQNGDLSVIWTHVSHLKRMTTEHITQALDSYNVSAATISRLAP
jgi:hypothetical protein